MSKSATKSPLRRKRPQQLDHRKIKELNEEHKGSLHKIDKRKVSLHSAGAGAGTGDLGGRFVPTTDQIAKINQFTSRTVTSDEVVAFTANAMNDTWDRDDEAFTRDTVKEFAALPQPYSPIGKNYLVDHDHTMAAVRGRIFDVTSKTMDGIHFLRPDIYTPKTDQYANFIENLDFGLNNFVSVGVVVDKATCSIPGCGSPVHTVFRWSWCEAGHEKGFYYDPKSDEKDSWGYFLPVDPSSKGAVKAQVYLSDAVDFYELSQVFLGSQVFAQLADKTPSIKSAVKSAAKRSIPIVGLSFKEAKEIAMPHEPDAVRDARKRFTVTEEDGNLVWIDEKSIKWTWNPDEDEKVLCLGVINKEGDDEDEEEPDTEDDESEDDANDESDEDDDEFEDEDADTEGGEGSDDASGDGGDDSGSKSVKAIKSTIAAWQNAIKQAEDTDEDLSEIAQALDGLADALDVLTDDLLEALGLTEDEEDGTAGDVAASAGKEAPNASAVLRAAVKAKLPNSITELIATAEDDAVLDKLCSEVGKTIKSQAKTIKSLEPKAVLGDEYVAEAEKTALHWFTVSRRDLKNPSKGVDVSLAQKMIKLASGDINTLKQLADDWKKEAEAKFPNATRRSTSPADVEGAPEELPSVPMDSEAAAKVRKLHG